MASTSSNPLIPPTTPETPPGQTSTAQPPSNSQNGPPPAAASGLYLYTFLATLVLLLCVSAAIVIRSLMMRIRNRRLIEEAIRNGTYIPPGVGIHHGRFRKKDAVTQPKPIFYDAYLRGGEAEWCEKWERVSPVAVSYAKLEKVEEKKQESESIANGGTSTTTYPNPPAWYTIIPYSRQLQLERLFQNNARRQTMISTSPNETSTTNTRTTNQVGNARALPATVSLSADELENQTTGAPSESSETKPESVLPVRITVVIAMPDPSRPVGSKHSSPMTNKRPSTSSSTSSTTSDDPLSSSACSMSSAKGKSRDYATSAILPAHEDEDAELPHIEFGVAEVRLVGEIDEAVKKSI